VKGCPFPFDLIPYGGWLVKGVGGGALVRPGPPRVKGAARPLRDRLRRPLTRGSLPVLGRGNYGQGGALPADRAPPPRPGCSLPSGGYRSALDRLRDRRRGCPAGKAASFVGATRV
jgi:hypothetical protein